MIPYGICYSKSTFTNIPGSNDCKVGRASGFQLRFGDKGITKIHDAPKSCLLGF